MIKQFTPIVSILAIAGLLAWAMYLRIDGLILAGGVAIIGGLGGFYIPRDKATIVKILKALGFEGREKS